MLELCQRVNVALIDLRVGDQLCTVAGPMHVEQVRLHPDGFYMLKLSNHVLGDADDIFRVNIYDPKDSRLVGDLERATAEAVT